MSDLRTRIAAVAQNHVRCDDCTFAKTPEQRYLHFADAVIRELGPLVRYWDKDFNELHYCRECGGWGPKDD